MRLIKLKIKNIASLKDEHEINFAQIQSQSPLFAITGETGAGKSSILNAIGLALYGKVYKSNVTQNDLVTLGEKEGQIELIFQAQGRSYLALWKARVRKQNGEPYSIPQTPQRELYTLEGDDFSSPKTILTTRVEELLNLDFEQFCKCIILNQGEFARFLSSSFSERKEILEKLYPGEMLESLSRALKSELDLFQKQKENLDIELKTLAGDGPQGEDLSSLKQSLEKDYKLHESWLSNLEKIEFHYGTLSSYHNKFNESLGKIDTVKQALSKDTTAFNELLLFSRKASEELSVVQTEQEAQLPRLQELLKSEESLRLALESKAEYEKDATRFAEQVRMLEVKSKASSESLALGGQKIQELQASLSFPLTELRRSHHAFEEISDLYGQRAHVEQELLKETERLLQLETQGKTEAQELRELQQQKTCFDDEEKNLLKLEAQRKVLVLEIETKQRSVLRSEEITLKIGTLLKEEIDLKNSTSLKTQELTDLQQEYLPLETTIKLQGLLSAVEVCLTHPILDESRECPVCKSDLSTEKIDGLRASIEKTDFSKIKMREAELSRSIMKKESELHQVALSLKKVQDELSLKKKETGDLAPILGKELQPLDSLDQGLSDAQKKVWEQEKLLRDEARLNLVLGKTREQYGALKKEITLRNEINAKHSQRLQELTTPMSFITELNLETINLLKSEARKYKQLLELEAQEDKLHQESTHLTENLKVALGHFVKANSLFQDLEKKTKSIQETLQTELAGKKVSEIITHLAQRVKDKQEALGLRDRDLKTQELRLKESQSRLYTLEELLRDIDLQFSKELHALKEISQLKLPCLSDELGKLIEVLGSLSLELKSPPDLFIPLQDLIVAQKSFYKEKTSELKVSFGSVSARLEDWEKRQDRIKLLTLKSEDLIQNLERRNRLYSVLGKDELRTFVLSLVEENLITQTNDELQKLCQGRYEIIHQSKKMKLTPEFYILDKFREGGLRKVSTLSGGETFMVSLAMALGLAEMTRGKAEIDSLFIDEGFGTLDQESLEDVLDMLKQIQTRGLMVGIISHVKALTNALPVNLLVSKKQDGTSKVGIIFN